MLSKQLSNKRWIVWDYHFALSFKDENVLNYRSCPSNYYKVNTVQTSEIRVKQKVTEATTFHTLLLSNLELDE